MNSKKKKWKQTKEGGKKTNNKKNITFIVLVVIIIIPIPFPSPKSTINIQIHHFKVTFMCPRSTAGVSFDSVEGLRSGVCAPPSYCALLVRVPDLIGGLTVWWYYRPKPQTKIKSDLKSTPLQRKRPRHKD